MALERVFIHTYDTRVPTVHETETTEKYEEAEAEDPRKTQERFFAAAKDDVDIETLVKEASSGEEKPPRGVNENAADLVEGEKDREESVGDETEESAEEGSESGDETDQADEDGENEAEADEEPEETTDDPTPEAVETTEDTAENTAPADGAPTVGAEAQTEDGQKQQTVGSPVTTEDVELVSKSNAPDAPETSEQDSFEEDEEDQGSAYWKAIKQLTNQVAGVGEAATAAAANGASGEEEGAEDESEAEAVPEGPIIQGTVEPFEEAGTTETEEAEPVPEQAAAPVIDEAATDSTETPEAEAVEAEMPEDKEQEQEGGPFATTFEEDMARVYEKLAKIDKILREQKDEGPADIESGAEETVPPTEQVAAPTATPEPDSPASVEPAQSDPTPADTKSAAEVPNAPENTAAQSASILPEVAVATEAADMAADVLRTHAGIDTTQTSWNAHPEVSAAYELPFTQPPTIRELIGEPVKEVWETIREGAASLRESTGGLYDKVVKTVDGITTEAIRVIRDPALNVDVVRTTREDMPGAAPRYYVVTTDNKLGRAVMGGSVVSAGNGQEGLYKLNPGIRDRALALGQRAAARQNYVDGTGHLGFVGFVKALWDMGAASSLAKDAMTEAKYNQATGRVVPPAERDRRQRAAE